MGFAFVNVFGVESFATLWPLMIIYGGVALAIAAHWALTGTRPVLLGVATVAGLVGGSLLGHLTSRDPARAVSVVQVQSWELAIAKAAERVDRHKERLARYIDLHLPNIPEVMHANCREFQDALAARGLLCVDVGPESGANSAVNPSARDDDAVALWVAYRSAKADLNGLIAEGPTE